MPATSFSSTA